MKKRNRAPFLISKEEFVEWYVSQPQQCHYCGIPEEMLWDNKLFATNSNIHRLTIDRFDNEIGYQIGNIVLACHRCNHIKSNFFTGEEMKLVAQNFITEKWKGRV